MELDQRFERELVSLVAPTRLRRCLSIRSSSRTLTVWFYFPAVISLLLVFLAGSNTAWAPATASVGGTVTDPSGVAVVGAAVAISNPESKTERSAATGSPLPEYTRTSGRVWFAQWAGLPGKYFFPGGHVRPFTLAILEK